MWRSGTHREELHARDRMRQERLLASEANKVSRAEQEKQAMRAEFEERMVQMREEYETRIRKEQQAAVKHLEHVRGQHEEQRAASEVSMMRSTLAAACSASRCSCGMMRRCGAAMSALRDA